MFMGQKRLALGSFLLPLILMRAAAADQVLLVQDDSYMPYMGAEQFDAVGIYSDILDEASKRLDNKEIALQAVPWPRALELVRNGAAQGLVGTYHWPVERPWIRHYSVPLFTEQVNVYCRPGIADAGWSFPDDFKGLTFGNNTGFHTPGTRFFELAEAGDITLLEARTTAMNLNMLELGRLDCYVQEQLSAEREIRRNTLKNIEHVQTISSETAHIGYSDNWIGPQADAFIVEMDRVLNEMHQDGSVDRIIGAYLGSS